MPVCAFALLPGTTDLRPLANCLMEAPGQFQAIPSSRLALEV